MYKICHTKESDQRERQIEHALLDIMQRCLYRDITISEICRKAEISRQTFYRYFDSVDDVLYALVDHSVQNVKYSCVGMDDFKLELEKMFEFYYQNPALVNALKQNRMEWLMICHTAKWNCKEDFDEKKISVQRKDLQRDIYNLYHSAGLLSLVLWFQEAGWIYTPKEMAAIVAESMEPVKVPQNLV